MAPSLRLTVSRSLGVNVAGHYNILRAFLPAIIAAKRGHVVTMSSVLGVVTCAQASDYCATKAAVLALHESLRYELDSHYNAPLVRTTVLTPGLILTPMLSRQRPLSAGSPLPAGLFNFLMPALPPHTVVKAIIAAMDEQESRDISLPAYTWVGWVARGFPHYIRDFIQWVCFKLVKG